MSVKSNPQTVVSGSVRLSWLSLMTLALLPTPCLSVSIQTARVGEAQRQQLSQTTVRGKLVRKTRGRVLPAAYVGITLFVPSTVRRSVPVYTDSAGIYYVDVPPGKYILEIWGAGQKIIKSYSINVPFARTFDIAPITIP